LFAGVGQCLIHNRVPAVVAMQYPSVRQQSAATFNTAFYRALLRNCAVDVAVNEGRQLLMSYGRELRDWGTPVLSMGPKSAWIVTMAARGALPPLPPPPEDGGGARAPLLPPSEETVAEAGPITKKVVIVLAAPNDATRRRVLRLIYLRLQYL